MSDELIVRHCSPTLAGMKTGNLFSCPYIDKQELLQSIRFLNKRLVPKGVRVIPLKLSDNRVLLYVYRPNKLKLDLAAEDASKILKEYGYSLESPAQCVAYLSQRLYASKEFPHEIGLFLGYPPEDVRGFIDNHAKSISVGCQLVTDESQKELTAIKDKETLFLMASGTNIETRINRLASGFLP